MVQLHADNPEHEAVLRKTGVPRTDPTAGVLTPAEAEARNLNQAGRIEIPCNDRVRLRYYADILRGLALSLEVASRNTEIPETLLLLGVKHDIKQAHQKIRSITRSGAHLKR